MAEGGEGEVALLAREPQLKKLSKISRKPRLLSELDIGDFAASLEDRFGRRWRRALEALLCEMGAPGADLRPQWRDPTAEEEFALLAGESADYIRPGKIVQCTVRRIVSGAAAAAQALAGAFPKQTVICCFLWRLRRRVCVCHHRFPLIDLVDFGFSSGSSGGPEMDREFVLVALVRVASNQNPIKSNSFSLCELTASPAAGALPHHPITHPNHTSITFKSSGERPGGHHQPRRPVRRRQGTSGGSADRFPLRGQSGAGDGAGRKGSGCEVALCLCACCWWVCFAVGRRPRAVLLPPLPCCAGRQTGVRTTTGWACVVPQASFPTRPLPTLYPPSYPHPPTHPRYPDHLRAHRQHRLQPHQEARRRCPPRVRLLGSVPQDLRGVGAEAAGPAGGGGRRRRGPVLHDGGAAAGEGGGGREERGGEEEVRSFVCFVFVLFLKLCF